MLSSCWRQHMSSWFPAAPRQVEASSAALPGTEAAWRALLARPTPLVFRGAATRQPAAPLLAATRGWSWAAIGEGLGPQVQAFIGAEGPPSRRIRKARSLRRALLNAPGQSRATLSLRQEQF